MRDINFENPYGDYFWIPSYTELVDSFQVEVLIEGSDDDYQGDSRFLLRDGERYGFLMFGWGSCSGCDALQACDTAAEVTELRNDLWNSVHWEDSKDEMARYVAEKGWELEWSWYRDETRTFVERVKQFLDIPTDATD